MEFVKKQMAYNHSARREAIKYIVIHDTGNTDRGADALRNFQYFNTGDRGSSADFFVDDTRCVQANDYSKYYSWHCGDGHGKYGITNSNSVGLEICVNSDGDYNTAFNNAVAFTKQLMNTLGIPIDRVVRHYDASRKNCPASMSKNSWALWNTFKQKISESEDLSMSQYEELKAMIEAANRENARQNDVINIMGQEIQYLIQQDEIAKRRYNSVAECPDWAQEAIQYFVDRGDICGDESGKLDLTYDMVREKVFDYRKIRREETEKAIAAEAMVE